MVTASTARADEAGQDPAHTGLHARARGYADGVTKDLTLTLSQESLRWCVRAQGGGGEGIAPHGEENQHKTCPRTMFEVSLGHRLTLQGLSPCRSALATPSRSPWRVGGMRRFHLTVRGPAP